MKNPIRSRYQKADCLGLASRNLILKSRAKGIDAVDKAKFEQLSKLLGSECTRQVNAAVIFGDKFSTRITGNQAPVCD